MFESNSFVIIIIIIIIITVENYGLLGCETPYGLVVCTNVSEAPAASVFRAEQQTAV